MARARRAKARPARVVVPIVVAVLAVGGVVGAQQGWFTREGASTSNVSPTVMASQRTAAPSESATSDPTSSSTSAEPSDEPSSDDSGGTAEQALADCRASVKAADKTWKAADTGIGHWSEHVQAQTDANSGKIGADRMDAIFKRTRLAGPDDVDRYEDARSDLKKKPSDSCEVPDGAPAGIKAELTACADRREAQQPVLEAAEDAMGDWESHLAAMRRSRMGHVHDAQGVWIRAWRAAPKNLEAYDKAEDAFDAPKC